MKFAIPNVQKAELNTIWLRLDSQFKERAMEDIADTAFKKG